MTPWLELILAPRHYLTLPIARSPLFPSFYKAVVIRNPQVVAAIKKTMKHSQPDLKRSSLGLHISNLRHPKRTMQLSRLAHADSLGATSRHVVKTRLLLLVIICNTITVISLA